ncbi:hypothetical protein [Myxococcus sp. Y35]|uniref:hypothetical protein n=1 Tax=Pseudomyxococcus flavus TaxID=3115648 RepID=UPI003CE77F1F
MTSPIRPKPLTPPLRPHVAPAPSAARAATSAPAAAGARAQQDAFDGVSRPDRGTRPTSVKAHEAPESAARDPSRDFDSPTSPAPSVHSGGDDIVV